jgi:hypothetical protein
MADKTHLENRGIIRLGCPFLPLPRRVKPVSDRSTERIEFFDETHLILYGLPIPCGRYRSSLS